MNKAGVIVRKQDACTLCKHDISFYGNTANLSYHLERKHPTMCLIDFHGTNIEISLCIVIYIVS